MTPPDSPDARRPNVTHAMFRDPAPMDPADLSRVGGRLADPRTATVLGGIETSPTAYVGASLVLSARADADREALLDGPADGRGRRGLARRGRRQ